MLNLLAELTDFTLTVQVVDFVDLVAVQFLAHSFDLIGS
jgi:hypothetical protein